MKKVLVTGGTGYIGSWVVKYLLEEGHTVKVTVRDKNRKDKIAHLETIAENTEGTLELWEADLLKDGSFDQAMEGCEVVYHIASPFEIGKVSDPYKQFINPAVNGTKNVLNAVNKTDSVKKVVLTSSVAAIYGDNIDIGETEKNMFTEEHWNTSSSDKHNPYSYSKVMAEKEAWKMHEAQSRWSLTVLNPGFVMGPSLTNVSNSGSLSFMMDILKGQQKMGAPGLVFSFVDVRDIARAHLLAADNDKAKGRHIIIEGCYSVLEFCNIIGKLFENKFSLPKGELPKFALYLFGWTQGISWKYVSNNVGIPFKMDNSKSRKELGLKYLPFEQTVKDNVNQILESNLL